MFRVALSLLVAGSAQWRSQGVRLVKKRAGEGDAGAEVEALSVIALSQADENGRWHARTPEKMFVSPSKGEPQREIAITLPSGKDIVVKVSMSKSDVSDVDVVRGTSNTIDFTAIREPDGVIAGSIVDVEEGMTHQFTGTDAGLLDFRSIATDQFPDEDGEPEEVELEEEQAEVESDAEQAALVATNASERGGSGEVQVISVLVVWSRAAECEATDREKGCTVAGKSKQKMEAKIDLATEQGNEAFTNSGINAKLKIVHKYRLPNFVETSPRNDLTRLVQGQIPIDGQMIRDLRDKYKADVVSMWVGKGGVCGQGQRTLRKMYAYSVVAEWCGPKPKLSFVHEIVHNMGVADNRGDTGHCEKNGEPDGKYNYGFRDPKGYWRDIMSHGCAKDCLNQPTPVADCTKVPYFSNPDLKIPDGPHKGQTLGASNANSVKWINENGAPKVANYY